MIYEGLNCNDAQRKLIDASECLLLDKEEQANFHFMIHLRNILKSSDFMEPFETSLLKRKYERLREHPDFAELDYNQSFIPLPKYRPEELTRERLQAMLNDPRVPPIVIKGLVSDAPAVRTWTHDYLMESYGDVQIMALQFDEGGSYQAAGSGDSAAMSLAEIIRAQLSGKAKSSYYVNNSAQIFNDYPQLLDEIGGQRVLDLFRGHSVNTFSQLFVGNVRTWGTNWHQGNDLSVALMINGVKRWYFIDPRLVHILRPYLNGPNGMMTKGEVRHSLDFQVLHDPLYAYMPKFVLDLEPGDALVFTKYWPHAVVNVSPFQIMANMRMTEVDIELLKKGNSTANLLPVFDNILNSDPEFIKFKFEIYQSLGKHQKEIGDSEYFAGFSVTRKNQA
jgi:hypothetical protein